MVKLSVVFVEGEQEDGLIPDLRVGGEGIEHASGEFRALQRRGNAGVLRP